MKVGMRRKGIKGRDNEDDEGKGRNKEEREEVKNEKKIHRRKIIKEGSNEKGKRR